MSVPQMPPAAAEAAAALSALTAYDYDVVARREGIVLLRRR